MGTHGRGLVGHMLLGVAQYWNGQVEDGRLFGCAGKKGPVSFRLLHVFEFSGDKISRENVWCDLAAIQQQLGVRAA